MIYVGGKTRIALELKGIIEGILRSSGIGVYVEPFVGGCNVIDKIDASVKIASDNNKYLIAMYKKLQGGWIPPDSISKELYDDIRVNKDSYPPEIVAIAGFCASYHGKWFGGYYGNSPRKINKVDFYLESIRSLKRQIKLFDGIEFKHGDYRMYNEIEKAVIYCDPPYKGTQDYLNKFDSDLFWDWVREMSKKNIVIVSEYYAPEDFKVIFDREVYVSFKGVLNIEREKVFTVNSTEYIEGLVEKYSKDSHLENSLDGMI